MTLTATLVWLVIGVSDGSASDGPTNTELKPTAAATTPGAVNFDALPAVKDIPEDARVKRFLGAFTGGVVGLGASLALMPLGDAVGACFGGPCISFVHGLVGVFAPLLSLGGSWLGFELMGGDGGLVTPSIALAPAILISLGLLSIAREVDASSVISLMPYVIAAGVFLAGGAALALDVRARQLNSLGTAQNWGKANAGRVAITSLVSGLSTAGVALASALFFSVGYTGWGIAAGFLTAIAGSFGVAAASWGVHRALNGRGSFTSSLVGLGIGMLTTLAGAGLYALSQGSGFTSFSPLRNGAGTILLIELGVAAALFSPVLALELSHTNAIEASIPKFTLSAAPTPNGGMVAAGMRF